MRLCRDLSFYTAVLPQLTPGRQQSVTPAALCGQGDCSDAWQPGVLSSACWSVSLFSGLCFGTFCQINAEDSDHHPHGGKQFCPRGAENMSQRNVFVLLCRSLLNFL